MLRLINFNDKWKDYFIAEKQILLNALHRQKVLGIEHIGATSVVLCATAGTIDLMCIIPSMIEFLTIKNLLTTRGYQYLKSMSTDDCYTYARRNEKNQIVALVRVVEQASKIHQEIVLFREYLRENEKHALSYNAFRQALINQNVDAKKYQEIKKNYIESILHDFCRVK